jgi:TRAP-type mannitol/chloroaromatic compound transport system substrate-binding protein
MTQKTNGAKHSRRQFIKAVAAGGVAAAAITAPNVSRAQTITWRFQSTWPTKDIFHEFASDYVKRVNEMSGGRLKLDLLAAGSVVGAFQVQDAVHSGTLDGGHGVTVYWYGKKKAASLFGTPAPWFRDANMLLAWFYHGGGEALYNELLHDILKLNVIGFLTGPMPTQPLGWFKKEIKSANDLKNIKYRTVGLSADLYNEMGTKVTIMPGGEIVPAIDRGLLDGAEFNNPSSDRLLGFPDVSKIYMLQSYHQHVESFEISFNKQKYESLPPELRAILRYASDAASADMSWKLQDRYPKDLQAMTSTQGVKAITTPKSVLAAQLAAWDKVIAKLSGEDAMFKKIVDSQLAFARPASNYFVANQAPVEMAYQHYFGGKAGGKKKA